MDNKPPPHLADLICEYVNERCSYKTAVTDYGPLRCIGVDIPLFGVKDHYWHVGIISRDNKYYTTLPNGKSVWIDMFGEDSLDIIYRIMRLDIAKRLRRRREFFKSKGMNFKNRKAFMVFVNG